VSTLHVLESVKTRGGRQARQADSQADGAAVDYDNISREDAGMLVHDVNSCKAYSSIKNNSTPTTHLVVNTGDYGNVDDAAVVPRCIVT